jgi:hypothetical protein
MAKWTKLALAGSAAVTVIGVATLHGGSVPITACACDHDDVILPAAGAHDVPRNTKLWTVGNPQLFRGFEANGVPVRDHDSASLGSLPGLVWQETPERLAADQTYVLRGYRGELVQSFTTGARDDTQPPAPPVVRALGVMASEYTADDDADYLVKPVVRVVFDGEVDADTVLLEYTLSYQRDDLDVVQTFVTTRDGVRLVGRPVCGTELQVPPLAEHVPMQLAVRAIDLAGNKSAPVVRKIELWSAPPTQAACARQTMYRKTTADHVVEVIGLVLIGLSVLAAVVATLAVLVGTPVMLVIQLVRWLRKPKGVQLPRAIVKRER